MRSVTLNDVSRLIARSARRQSALGLLTFCIMLGTATGCVVPGTATMPTPQLEFNLAHPPAGWHRTVDSLSSVVLWLPPDWEMFTTPEGVDYSRETYYQPQGISSTASIGVQRIRWVDFAKNPRDPSTGRYPQRTYNLTIDGVVIPCARYEYEIWPYPGKVPSAKHVCIVYTSRRDVVWELCFHVSMKEEDTLLSLWRPVLTSFLQEEQPW